MTSAGLGFPQNCRVTPENPFTEEQTETALWHYNWVTLQDVLSSNVAEHVGKI